MRLELKLPSCHQESKSAERSQSKHMEMKKTERPVCVRSWSQPFPKQVTIGLSPVNQ